MARQRQVAEIPDLRVTLLPRFTAQGERFIGKLTVKRVVSQLGGGDDPIVVRLLLTEAFATALKQAGYLDPWHCFNCGGDEGVLPICPVCGAVVCKTCDHYAGDSVDRFFDHTPADHLAGTSAKPGRA
jgi:hypothetical protein